METIISLIPGNLYFAEWNFTIYKNENTTGFLATLYSDSPFLLLEIKCRYEPWLVLKILQSNKIGWIAGIDKRQPTQNIKLWKP